MSGISRERNVESTMTIFEGYQKADGLSQDKEMVANGHLMILCRVFSFSKGGRIARAPLVLDNDTAILNKEE
jgi:hypothetical protein